MTMIRKLTFAALLAPALVALSSNAAEPGFYIGGGGGQVNVNKDASDYNYKGSDFEVNDDDAGWKAFVGYNFLPWLGVEGGYVDFGNLRQQSGTGETIRVDPTGWDAFLVASLPLGPVDLFAKVGGIALDTDINTAQFGSDNESDTQLAYGAGIAYNVGQFAFRVEAEGFDDNEVDDFYMVSAGVTYHFAKKKPAPVATAVAPPVVAAACTDTDNDGVCDTEDQCPTTPSGAKVDSMGCLCHYSMAMEFAFDSAKLSDSDMAQLDGLVPVLTNPKVNFIGGMIEGYTDSMGSEDYNMGLSQRRADSVVEYLSSKGVNLDGRFTAKGYGEADPVASNDTKEGRAQNRRVVVRRTDCDK